MRRMFFVFAAALVFISITMSQPTIREVNRWTPGTEPGVDTIYSWIVPDGGIRGDTCQLFGFRSSAPQVIATWEKRLDRSFRKPDFVRFDARLANPAMPSPQNSAKLSIWVGDDIDTALYPIGNPDGIWLQIFGGATGWQFDENRVTTQVPCLRITRVVLKFAFYAPQPDSAEWLLNDLRAVYGTSPHSADSVVMMDSYGDELGMSDVREIEGVPTGFALAQNYPNPFNPATTITFEVTARTPVRLAVYDALGREIAVLADETIEPGRYESVWNASGVASGTYFYHLATNRLVQTKKMVLMK